MRGKFAEEVIEKLESFFVLSDTNGALFPGGGYWDGFFTEFGIGGNEGRGSGDEGESGNEFDLSRGGVCHERLKIFLSVISSVFTGIATGRVTERGGRRSDTSDFVESRELQAFHTPSVIAIELEVEFVDFVE